MSTTNKQLELESVQGEASMRTLRLTRRLIAALFAGAMGLMAHEVNAQCIAPAQFGWVGTNGAPGGRYEDAPTRNDLSLESDGKLALAGFFKVEADLDPTDGVALMSPMGGFDGTANLVGSDGTGVTLGLIGGGFGESCYSNDSASTGGLRYAGTFGFGPGGDYCGDLDPYEEQAIFCAQGAPNRFGAFIGYVSRTGEFEYGGLLTSDDVIGAVSVATAPDNGAVVTWYFTGSADLDPGEGQYIVKEHGQPGARDAYLLKLDESAEFSWALAIGGNLQDEGEHLIIDAVGNIYWMGRFALTVDFDPGPGEDFRTSQSGSDMFVCKYTSNGEYLWTQTVDTRAPHSEYSMEVSADGRLMIAGWFTDNVDFDPTAGQDWRRAAGLEDGFVSVWTTDGDYLWTITLGGEPFAGADAAFDGNGDIIVSGGFSGTVDFDHGPGEDMRASNGELDAYVAKYTRDGQYQWAQTFGGESMQGVWRMAVNRANGDIWLDGMFRGTVDFDPGPGEAFRTSVGERDLFLMKMTCDGRGCEELTGHSA
ncbi:MAG: hypothetical protein IT164_16755, partial [Bryobacterales bacterium]|nr:hypothetical protein [Bryobacterales bacterium]